jgi:ankyrin repeat protein
MESVFSFLECQNKAYLQVNELIGSKLGSKRFPSTKFSIDTWVRFSDSTINTPMGIMEYTLNIPGTSEEATALSLTLHKDKIQVILNGEQWEWNLPYNSKITVNTINANEWNHISVVWSQSTGNIRPYLNGLLAGDAENLSNEPIPNKGTLRLYRSSKIVPMGGSGSTMSEFRLWSDQMTESDARKAMHSVSPTVTLPSLELFVHYRLMNDLTASLEDLNGVIDSTSSADLPHSLKVMAADGETDSICYDSESDILINTNAIKINNIPLSYVQRTYDQATLRGSGLASDPTFNVDAGSEVSIVSFEDDNIITRQSSDDSMTLNEQQSILISGCSELERITSTGGSFALGTRAPLMSWIPKSFRGSNFAIPALRGDTLTVTVRSLSSELSEAELGDTIAKVTKESVRYHFGDGVETITSTGSNDKTSIAITSSGCIKRIPDSVDDNYESTSSEPTLMFDSNVKTYWRKRVNTPSNCIGTDSSSGTSTSPYGYPHCLDFSFSIPTAVSRYSFSNYEGFVQPKSWELYGRSEISDSWIKVDTQNNILWNSERFVTKKFWSNSVTLKDSKYKLWKFKFLATDHPTYVDYVELSEINLFECENELLTGTNDRAKGSDLITMHGTEKIGTSDELSFGFGSNTMQTDNKWSCTTTEPVWYWRTTEYEMDQDPNTPVWSSAKIIGTVTDLSSRNIDTIWHSSAAASEIWCRMAYGEAPASLTLTHSYNGVVKKGVLPRNGIYTFALARGAITSSSWFRSWFTLQATTSVVVSARSGDSDSRAVPSVSQRFVGWSSKYGKMAPFYHDTSFQVYYFTSEKLVSNNYNGGIDENDDTQFTVNSDGLQYLSPRAIEYSCEGAAHAYGNKPIGIGAYEDGDGSSDATTFFPIERLSTEFILPRKAEWVSFVTVRPEANRGIVNLKVFDPLGRLIDNINENFARSTSKQASNLLDDIMRPSCYKYESVSGISAGTKFITDYPTHMVFDEFVTSDETSAFGRGSWGWVEISRKHIQVLEKNSNIKTSIQNYKLRFQSHDPNNKLSFNHNGNNKVTLGQPLSDVKISLSTDSEINVSPSYVIFTKENWNKWQTINVSAVEDNKVETLIKTSVIKHFIDTLDPNFADGRINIPDVAVDVINVDFDSTVRNLKLKSVTGGMIGIQWDPPEATLAAGNKDTFDYILEITNANNNFMPPTILHQTVSCTDTKCTAIGTFDINFLSKLRSASVTINVRKTDFNDATEIVETISATVKSTSDINNIQSKTDTLRSNCNPGKSSNGGYCGKDDAFACITKQSVLSLLNELSSNEKNVTISFEGTISEDVGPTSTCKDSNGIFVPLFTMDITLELIYVSNDEVYYGKNVVHYQPGLKHSTSYRVRAATMNNHGVLSAWTPNEENDEPPLIIKTTRPTKPSAPISPKYKYDNIRHSRTGGSLTLIWDDVFDTGGAEIVEYNILAMEIGASGNAISSTIEWPHYYSNVTSRIPDASRPWETLYSNMLTRPVIKENKIVGLKSFSKYNVTVYAANDVEFCVGDSLTGYERAHVFLESGLYASDSVVLETGRPSKPTKPLNFMLIDSPIESGGSMFIQITAPYDAGGHTLLQYDVNYRKISDGILASYDTVHGSKWYESHVNPIIRIQNLIPNTKYEIRVRVSTQPEEEDSFTSTPTGCECDHDARRTDCACCKTNAYKQCGASARTKCYDDTITSVVSACSGDRSDIAWYMSEATNTEIMTLYDWKQKDVTEWTLDSYTYSLWMKITSLSPSLIIDVELIKLGNLGPTLRYTYDGIEGTFTYATKHTTNKNLEFNEVVNNKYWVHVAITRNDKKDILYIDGDNVDEFVHPIKPDQLSISILNASPKIKIDSSTALGLEIDNVFFWSKALSIDEIRSISMKGALSESELITHKATDTLLVYEDFNQKGTTALERSQIKRSLRGLSEWSHQKIFLTPIRAERPTRPTNSPVLVSVHGGKVIVKWDNDADNGGSPVTNYHLYRTVKNPTGKDELICSEKVHFEDPNNEGSLILKTSELSVSVDNTLPDSRSGTVVRLDPLTTYGICVASSNSEGKSEKSRPLSVTTLAAEKPGKPPSPYVIKNPIGVDLSWNEVMIGWKEPADIGGSSITGYYLEWRKENDQDFQRSSLHTNLVSLYITIDSMVANTLYTYRVVAVNNQGESIHSDEYQELSSAKCLTEFYGTNCESFNLCTIADSMTSINPMRTSYCDDLTTVLSVSYTYSSLFASPTGATGRGGESLAGGESAQPLPTLKAAMDKVDESTNMVFIYPEIDPIVNRVGYCNVEINQDVSILGIRNSSDVWQGTTIKCTNETKNDHQFDRFLIVKKGITLKLSGVTLIGGGIEVQGGTFEGSYFSISNGYGNLHGGAFWVHDAGTISLVSANVNNNHATYGGAISVRDKSTIQLCDTNINNNNAAKDGGGIYMIDSSLSSSCSDKMSYIQLNTATQYGGGIHCTGSDSSNTGTCSIDGSTTNSIDIAITINNNRLNKRDINMLSGAGLSFRNIKSVNVQLIGIQSNIIDGNGWGGGLSFINVGAGSITDSTVNNNIINILKRVGDPLVSGGGGINIQNSKVDITDCMINDNSVKSTGTGGGLLVDGSNTIVNLIGGKVKANYANYGGGIDVQGASTLDIKLKSFIIDNTCINNGGGLHVSSGSIVFTNDIGISNNIAGKLGGGVAVSETGSTLSMTSTSFLENSAANGGSVALSSGTSITLRTCSMGNSIATENGGDIWVSASAANTLFTLQNVTSTNSTAKNDGGVLWSTGPAIISLNTHTVQGSHAGRNGGSISIFDGTKITATTSTYRYTSSGMNGGMLYITKYADITFDGVTVLDVQSVKGSGGVAYVSNHATLLMKDSNIHRSTSFINGGGVSINSFANVNVQNTNTFQCTSGHGGVFHVNNATLTTENVISTGSNARVSGGTLSAIQKASITMKSSQFKVSNAVSDGGHIWLSSTTQTNKNILILEDVTLISGSAERGGSMYSLHSDIYHDGTCLISKNVARSNDGGGSLYLSSSDFTRTQGKTSRSSLLSSTASNGGAVTTVGNVKINYIDIKNHETNNSGTIHVMGIDINQVGSSLTLEHVDMNSNSVGDYGGHVFIDEGGSIVAKQLQLTNGTAGKGGGALYGAEKSSVQLVSTNVLRNQNTAILFEGKNLNILSSSLSNNYADRVSSRGGGAINAGNGANVTLTKTIFRGNVATNKEGGDVACSGMSTCTIIKTSFRGNDKSLDPLSGMYGTLLPSKGGAISVVGGSVAYISDTTFNTTYTKIGGGALHISYSSLYMKNVEIDGSHSNKGAGLLLENAIFVHLEHSTFQNCESIYDGGAIHATDSNVIAEKLKFLNNKAGIFGGAILVSEKASLNMTSSTFNGNIAWLGGALAMDRDSKSSISKTIFEKNQARMGGAFYVSVNPDLVTFDESNFTSNTARFGSALFVEFSFVEIKNSIIKNNIATLFAAVRVTGIGGFISTSSIFENNVAQKGGALYVDDQTKINLIDSTFIRNIANLDGGAIHCGGTAIVTVYGCQLIENTAEYGQGGAISRTSGARLVVDELTKSKVTTFSKNIAKTVGGAMSLNGLLCRSVSACQTDGADDVNAMTSAYESCRSGAVQTLATKTGSAVIEELEACTNIKNVHFVDNQAASGAGIYWSRQWHFEIKEHSKFLPCPKTTCTFNNNMAVPCTTCKETDLGCYSCISNTQTDTQTIVMGWSSGYNMSIQSGTPIENNNFLTSPEDTDIYLVAVDFYGNLSRLDDQSNCYVERNCPSTSMGDLNCYDMQAGVCKVQNLNEDKLAKNKILMTGTTATSKRGIIRFLDLIVKADPNPLIPYEVRYICKTKLEEDSSDDYAPCIAPVEDGTKKLVDDTESSRRRLRHRHLSTSTTATTARSPIIVNSFFLVDHCAPGSQLTGDQVCEKCSSGTYSPDGMKCSTCPVGGSCSEKIKISKKSSVSMGVAYPRVMNGYWNNTAPKEWFENECNTTAVIIPGTKSPYEIVTTWGNNEECQPGDCGGDKLWDSNRLHRCRRNKHFYKCDQDEACTFTPAKYNSNGTKLNNESICNEGYEGVVCGVCSIGYHKTGNDQCIKCMGDDPVISQILYTGSLVLFIILSFLVLYLYLKDKNVLKCSRFILGFIHCCQCCHECWCQCRCCKKSLMTEDEKIISNEIAAMKNAGQRRRGIKAGDVDEHMKNETVWFRPEKYKILLSFLQVFQEFRRTYRIKWPPMVEEYMDYFSGLVDFDVFRLTSVDCIFQYNYLHKVWFVVIFPTGCLLLLVACHLLGRSSRSRALKLNARMIDGTSTGFVPWPPRKMKRVSEDTKKRSKSKNGKILGEDQRKLQKRKTSYHFNNAKSPANRLSIAQDSLNKFRSSRSMWSRCCLCCNRCIGRILNLEHANLYKLGTGPRRHEKNSPEAIKEVKDNVQRWKKRVKTQINMAFFLNKIIRIFFWILLLSFIPVTSVLLRFFLCDPIADGYYLNADLRVQCNSPEYSAMLPIAVFGCGLYIFGIPACFFMVLTSARNESIDALTMMLSEDEHERARYLAMARADIETEGGIFRPPKSVSGALQIIREFTKRKNLRSHKTRSRIGFIVQSYSEWAWWYEMWELLRKLMLVGVIALLRPGTVMQILWGLGICVGSSFVSLLIRPYNQLDDGWLNNLCLAQLQFVLFCGLLIRLKVDLFEKEGKGDSTYNAEYAIGVAVVGSHVIVMFIALCLLSYELVNAPRHQAAVRAGIQRKTEAARRNLELWAKGRRMALMRKAKREKESGSTESTGATGKHLNGQVTELETEQLAREAELRDEYNDLQKEIESLGLINEDETSGTNIHSGHKETHHFLLSEKERMEKKKNQLELQMQSIINENKQNVQALETAMNAKKDKAKSRLAERLAKRRNKSSVGGLTQLKRGKSKFKRLAGIGHDGERNIDGKHHHHHHHHNTSVVPIDDSRSSDMNTIMCLQDHQKRIHLEEAHLEAKNDTVFKLLAYYGTGDSNVDNSILKYIQEHASKKGDIDIPRDDSGSTLLTAAVRVGNIKCAQLLLTNNANIATLNQDKATCLHYAAFSGNTKIVDLILKANTIGDDFINMLDSRGNTAATYAAIAGHTLLANKLGLQNTTAVANINRSETSKRNQKLSKWRRAAWRTGISTAISRRGLQTQFQQMIALAKAKKSMEEQLLNHGNNSFDPSISNEHTAIKEKLQKQVEFLEKQLQDAKDLMDTNVKGGDNNSLVIKLKQELLDIKNKESNLQTNLEREIEERKRLHNQIEDMKGVMRVFCRIRPMSSSEIAKNCLDVIEYANDRLSVKLHLGGNDKAKENQNEIKSYSFDSVFSPMDDQNEIYRDVNQLVQSAIDGYNVCIFAYGQTGSGKTYTMNGITHSPGIQPRSASEIFNIVSRDSSSKDFTISSYMIEMSLENLYDLYKNNKKGAIKGKRDKYNNVFVTKDANGQVIVNGVKHCTIKTSSDLNALLESGLRNRTSSRSHIISTIIIEATDRKTKLITTGKLTLVDLAGIGASSKSSTNGNDIAEAKAISSSLSALSGVIR